MKKKLLLLLIIQVFSLNVLSQNYLWLKQIGKIKPLVSTEKDVVKLLGKAQGRYADIGEYMTKDGLFTVVYSQGVCKSSVTPYQVPARTVIQYNFRPQKEIIFSKLGINVSNWEMTETKDVGLPTVTYQNEDLGVNFEVQDNILNYVDVYPTEQFDYLLCSNYY